MNQPFSISPALEAQKRLENTELKLQALQSAQASVSPDQVSRNAAQLLSYLVQPSSGPRSDKAELQQQMGPLQQALEGQIHNS